MQILPTSAGKEREAKVTWLGSYVTPSLRWEVKARSANPGPHTIKLAVALPDGTVSEWLTYGEGNSWNVKMVDQSGGVTYGIGERGAYLSGVPNNKPSPFNFTYNVYVDDEQIAHGTYQWQTKYSYSKNQPRSDHFILPPITTDKTNAAGSNWEVSTPRIVFYPLNCIDKFNILSSFTAIFEF
ncbi:MAG: hypothetical protein HY711_11145, partial [Candidatus Melainabacteria bacterium]|nr:hypothetical protein [Candidatus Melainabacteria bacterium]